MASAGKAIQLAEQHSTNTATGQDDMFGLEFGSNSVIDSEPDSEFAETREMDEQERLKAEKETLGFYVHGHPITRYEQELLAITTSSLNAVNPGVVRVAGYIESIRTRAGQRGRMAEIRIDDRTARMVVNLYSEVYEKYRSVVQKDKLVIISGEAIEDDYYTTGVAIRADKVMELPEVRALCGILSLRLDNQVLDNGKLHQMKEILAKYSGQKNQVVVEYNNEAAKGKINLGDAWKVNISDQLLEDLAVFAGNENVSVTYKDVHKHFSSPQRFKFISGLH